MIGGLTATLISFDRLCGEFAAAVQGCEPKIYSAIILTALLWFLLAPPKDDSDQA